MWKLPDGKILYRCDSHELVAAHVKDGGFCNDCRKNVRKGKLADHGNVARCHHGH